MEFQPARAQELKCRPGSGTSDRLGGPETVMPPRNRARVPSDPAPPRPPKERYPVPREFRPDRGRAAGRYPLLDLFPGFERTPPFRKYPGDDREIVRIARGARVFLNDGPGYMYVAPRRTPPEVRAAGFRMEETDGDAIVVARRHLAKSPLLDVYLDLVHEFLHLLQRHQGRDLWPRRLPYADRPTEVEAYAYSIAEARRLGVPDPYLRRYLVVPWLGRRDFQHLVENLGLGTPRRK